MSIGEAGIKFRGLSSSRGAAEESHLNGALGLPSELTGQLLLPAPRHGRQRSISFSASCTPETATSLYRFQTHALPHASGAFVEHVGKALES